MGDFIQDNFGWVMTGGVIIVLGLVGVLLFLRSKRPED
jgi:glutamate synthase domain-containing protein 3